MLQWSHLQDVTQSKTASMKESRRRTVIRPVNKEEWTLDYNESNITVMMLLGGARFNQIWENFHSTWIYRWIVWLANILYYGCGFSSALGIFSDETSLILAYIYFGTVVWSVLHYSSFMNVRILKEAITEFDNIFFLTELVLFEISQWAIMCFSLRGFLLAFGKLIWIFLFTLYDSFPLYYRRENRKFLVVGCIMLISLLSLYYFKVPRGICYYTYNLSHPASEDDVLFSFFPFYFNRGFTVLLLLTKITVWSFRYPNHCVVITSHVQVTETYLTAAQENQEKSTHIKIYSISPQKT